MSTLQPPDGVFQGGNVDPATGKDRQLVSRLGLHAEVVPGFTITADWYQLFTPD